MRAFCVLRAGASDASRGTNGEIFCTGGARFRSGSLCAVVKRSHGSGHLYVKYGSYYGRWRGVDGRLINRKMLSACWHIFEAAARRLPPVELDAG